MFEADAICYAIERATRDKHACVVYRESLPDGSVKYYARHADSGPPWTANPCKRIAFVHPDGRVSMEESK